VNLDDLHYLQSGEGQMLLAELAAAPLTPDLHLIAADRLRQRVGPGRAQAILETTLLRQRAARKFSRAGAMFFTRDGLEQATAEPVAAHRARRFSTAGIGVVADLGCGIGGDALALAAAGASVLAIDFDGLRAAMTRANAVPYGVAERVLPVVADLMEMPPLRVDAFFFDPARRTASGPRLAAARRLRSVEDYQPPLSLINRWPTIAGGAVKVSPGIDYAELPEEAEAEFVSLDGELREAALWIGSLRTEAARRATLLPSGDTLTERDGDTSATVSEPRGYLYEPDAAIIRAHLVAQLASRLDAALIDPSIAYLTADRAQITPFARCFRVSDYFPFQLKRLRQYLRQRGIGQVTIKKRGSPLDPDVLRQALKLRGSNHAMLFLTQVMGQPTVIIGES